MAEPLAVEGDGRRRPVGRADLAAAALCVAVGVAMAILPHLIWWPRLGAPVYVADHDDLLYLTVARQAYRHHPTALGDPTRVSGGVSMYNTLVFVPGILAAKGLGLGPLGINLAWRALAGLGVALGWYALMRHYLGRPWVAAALAVFMLADVGATKGLPLARTAILAGQMATGRGGALFDDFPRVQPEWRIITPAMSLAFLLLHLWLLARARDRPTAARIAAAGAGFGLLFYAYFYYWTAAGLALLVALALDAGRRRVYFFTGAIGGLIGLPAVVSGMLAKHATAPDWLPRNDTFLPIARTSELLLPKLGLVLMIVGLAWVWARRRDLVYLWALATAGLLLLNHQVVSGLQIQNFHWSYVWEIGYSALFVLLIAGAAFDRPALPRAWLAGLFALVALDAAAGFGFRALEATRTRQTREILAAYRDYRDQRLAPGVPPLAPDAVVAGDLPFVNQAVILEDQRPLAHYTTQLSPDLDDRAYLRRIALNAALRGLDRPAFAADHEGLLVKGWGPWSRDPALRAAALAESLRDFDAFRADPAAGLAEYGVRYLAIPAGQVTPSPIRSGWRRLQAGPTWQVWEREDQPRPR